ncbi:PLDc N-terminal domain-containing protein [Plantibacter sp. YIM 135249]|uniref:PLDc N-terminal domain-containing protein n=1 Tax=Plantibacter sp. YIM 135249 TaxID=3423918 RepID=UPI003D3353CF
MLAILLAVGTIACLALVISALIEVSGAELTGKTKALWIIAILVAPFLGAGAWFLTSKRDATADNSSQ